MKKIIAFLTVLFIALPLVVSVFAFAPSCSLNAYFATTGYNAGKEIELIISIEDISFGDGDGVSAFEFQLGYDPSQVTFAMAPVGDSINDTVDFSNVISSQPGGWEASGRNYADEGVLDMAVSDMSGSNVIVNDNAVVLTLRFNVASNVSLNKLKFRIYDGVAYNKDMSVSYNIPELEKASYKSIQPATSTTLPSAAIPLHVAGYSNKLETSENSIFYAVNNSSVNEFVSRYVEIVGTQSKLSNRGIIVADSNHIITYVDLSLSDTSDKSEVLIPKGSYIIVIHGDNSSNISKLKTQAKLGEKIQTYNVNVIATGYTLVAMPLTNAGFTIVDPSTEIPPVDAPSEDDPVEDDSSSGTSSGGTSSDGTSSDGTSSGGTTSGGTSSGGTTSDGGNTPVVPFDIKPDANAKFSENYAYVLVYEYNQSLEEFREMFTGDFEVWDSKNKVVNDGKVQTGMFVVSGQEKFEIVIMGDLNSDANVNSRDYVLLKRHCFGTYTLKGAQFQAALLTGGKKPTSRDYVGVKRVCFGTLTMPSFK